MKCRGAVDFPGFDRFCPHYTKAHPCRKRGTELLGNRLDPLHDYAARGNA